MPTPITSHIGPGRNYNTPQLWEDALISDLISADITAHAVIHKEGPGTDGEWVVATALLVISSRITDANRYIELRAADGESFRDHPSVATNPLAYNPAFGVALRTSADFTTTIALQANHVRLFGLQVKAFGRCYQPEGRLGIITDSCIFDGRIGAYVAYSTGIWLNCLLISTGSAFFTMAGSPVLRIQYCTLIGDQGTSYVADVAYNAIPFENCAYFNFFRGFSYYSGGSVVGSNNATDLTVVVGTSSQANLVFANQFENTATDYRVKAGSNLLSAGVHNASYTVDIRGAARSASAPTIGCWEFVSAAATGVPMQTFIVGPL